jgi:hypothetical protein
VVPFRFGWWTVHVNEQEGMNQEMGGVGNDGAGKVVVVTDDVDDEENGCDKVEHVGKVGAYVNDCL